MHSLDLQSQSEIELDLENRARLLTNSPDMANRWVSIAGTQYPILHLGIGNMEIFKSKVAKLESYYSSLAESELGLVEFLDIYGDDVVNLLENSIPHAASVCIGVSQKELKKKATPIELLTIVISQWAHNMEIGTIRDIYPFPDSDDDDDEEYKDNPMTIVERLMSGFHCSKEEAMRFTYPQVYMMSVSNAESYERAKRSAENESGDKSSSNMGRLKSKIEWKGRVYNHPKEMPRDEYKQYMAYVWGNKAG